MFLYVGSYLLIYEFESWITGVCSPYVASLCDCVYYVVGLEPAFAMHLALRYVVLVCHQYDVCKKIYWQCVCWWVWWSERKRNLGLP